MKGRFYSLNDYLQEKFGEKIYKVSLDGGFTCPNRDGKISRGGCIFCSEKGSGEFAGNSKKTIYYQIEEQIKLLSKKYRGNKYIAYFQNFTNTYAEVEKLEEIYETALSHPNIIGLAIATRPDCIDDKILKLLSAINKKTFLWIELGLQTINDEVANFINRGYKTEIFLKITEKLNRENIKFVSHIIIGLPNENKDDYIKTALYVQKCKTWGLKIHLMYVVAGTKLEKLYLEGKFKTLEKDEYVERVINVIANISPDIVIHRLTGDGKKSELLAPEWSLNKKDVLNSINKSLKFNNIYQGMKGKEYESSDCG